MTHEEYKKLYLTKSVDNDWVYGKQCMDMAHHYCKSVYGVDCPRWDAYSLWSKKRDPRYIKIENTLSNHPRKWDIVIFAPTTINKYWHIAVVDNGNPSNLAVVEQNGWSGNWDGKGTNAIRLAFYNYVQPKVVWRFRYLPEKKLIENQIKSNSELREQSQNQELRQELKRTNDYLRSLIG